MKTGIYQIVNLVNGKRYIGSALNLRKRINKHRSELNLKRHHAPHLQYSWSKYGEDSFKFEVLLYCEKEELIYYEQVYINSLNPEYNAAKVAGSCLGTKRTAEQCKAISERLMGHATSEETKEKIRIGNQQKNISEEHKLAISAFQKDKPKSIETRAKMSAWQIDRKLPEESKLKMSTTRLKMFQLKREMGIPDIRKPCSEESKAKISATKKLNNLNKMILKEILTSWTCAL